MYIFGFCEIIVDVSVDALVPHVWSPIGKHYSSLIIIEMLKLHTHTPTDSYTLICMALLPLHNKSTLFMQ